MGGGEEEFKEGEENRKKTIKICYVQEQILYDEHEHHVWQMRTNKKLRKKTLWQQSAGPGCAVRGWTWSRELAGREPASERPVLLAGLHSTSSGPEEKQVAPQLPGAWRGPRGKGLG